MSKHTDKLKEEIKKGKGRGAGDFLNPFAAAEEEIARRQKMKDAFRIGKKRKK